MSFHLEYHFSVRSRVPAPVVLFSLLVMPAVFVASSSAQMNAANSSGVSGHAVTGTVPSAVVPVHPFTGTVPFANPIVPNGTSPNNRGFSPNQSHNGNGHHHHHDGGYAAPYFFGVPVPYAYADGPTDENADADANSQDADDSDTDYQGGPTVFDRRGAGADSYVPPVRDVPTPHAAQYIDANPDDPPQKTTLLIFKDGHKLEVGNYAIIGDTLFDLTPGHRRKIALAELDLDATREQNEDQGVIFAPPPQAN